MSLDLNEQQIVSMGVRRGELKRKRSNWKRFFWRFLVVAILTLGIVFSMAYLIKRDNEQHFPLQQKMYNTSEQAVNDLMDTDAWRRGK